MLMIDCFADLSSIAGRGDIVAVWFAAAAVGVLWLFAIDRDDKK